METDFYTPNGAERPEQERMQISLTRQEREKAAEQRRLERWKERLSSLPDPQQKAISKKYYSGKRPWREVSK